MKVVKPGKLGVVTRAFEHARKHYLGVSVIAYVPLSGPANLLGDVALWTFLPKRLAVPVLDVGVPKARAEYIVDGYAYAPGGSPLPSVPVRAQVGELDKTLNVFGDRYWTGSRATPPRPFTSMRLGWDKAFGGAKFQANPEGKGTDEVEIEDVMIVPLPNVEYPRQLVDSPRSRPDPACLLPVDISWPQRQRLAGTYDQSWLENMFPALAADADWGLFNIASRDQQREGWFSPGEPFRFDNMHPQKPVVEGELPHFVGRAFVDRRIRTPKLGEDGQPTGEEEVSTRFYEVPLALQTLWFFPDVEQAIMIFQGSIRVREEDASDVLSLLLAAENAGQPRSREHYEQALRARLPEAENPAVAYLREHELLPEGLPDAPEAYALEELELTRDEGLLQANMYNKAVREVERARATLVDLGLDPDVHGPPIPEPPAPPPSAEELVVLAAQLEREAVERGEVEKARVEERLGVVGALVDELGIPGFTSETLRKEVEGPAPIGPPTFTAASMLASIKAMADDFRSRGTLVDELEQMCVDEQLYTLWEAAEVKMREGYRISAHLQHPAPPLDLELHAAAQDRVRRALAAGEDFAGLNLTGADLSNMQLAGAKLAGAFLESARLDGCDLSGADLSGAVLAHASLIGAKLDGAICKTTNFGKATLTGSSFVGADLSEAVLFGADLSQTSLVRANLTNANLLEARFEGTDASEALAEESTFIRTALGGICLRGAKLARTSFIEIDLSGADLSEADLSQCTFLKVKALGTQLRGATMINARFVTECDLSGAQLEGANLSKAYLRDTPMDGCVLARALLDGADLCGCSLVGANFYQCVARETKFDAADLSDAVMLSANLMNSSFSRAIIRGADLRGTNLYAADMARVRSDERVQLDDALLTKVRIHPRYDPALDVEPEDSPHG